MKVDRASRNISFEAHIQTIAQLIYKCQQHEAKDPYLSIPWTNLGKYALAQSTTKFAERFQNQDITATLRKLREWCKFDSSAELCPDNRNPGLEQQDLHLIKIFVKGCSKDPGYPLLSCLLSWEVVQEDYLPEEDGPLLKELTSVILDALDLLGQTSEKLQQLRDLEVPPPRAQFEAVLEKAWYWSCVFDHVSWNSSFFEWFFTGYIQSLIYRYQTEISVDGPEGELLIAMIGAVNPVEYTTKVAPGIVDPYEIDEQKYLIWLRLISWPVKNALSFSYTRKVWSGVSLTCQVIQYSGTSSDMMPWQDVVLTLFPKDPAKCQQIIQALRDFSKAATHDELHAFRFNYWKFKNNVHSEAELACLYILSKIGMKPVRAPLKLCVFSSD